MVKRSVHAMGVPQRFWDIWLSKKNASFVQVLEVCKLLEMQM